ncbi:hypothetical protein CCP3SC1_2110003 [Gammaproteobacteria bacterium]
MNTHSVTSGYQPVYIKPVRSKAQIRMCGKNWVYQINGGEVSGNYTLEEAIDMGFSLLRVIEEHEIEMMKLEEERKNEWYEMIEELNRESDYELNGWRGESCGSMYLDWIHGNADQEATA